MLLLLNTTRTTSGTPKHEGSIAMDGGGQRVLFNTTTRAHSPRVLRPPATALLTYNLRKDHTLLGVTPCSHITSRWYSSPDCAPAAILGQITATHEIGLGA